MRSPIWFVVAGAIALGAVAGAVLYVPPRIGGIEAQLMQAVMPGSVDLALNEVGGYTIFHEQKSMVDGRYYASASADGLQLSLVSVATGAAVPLSEPSISSNYSIANRSGTSIFAFTVEQPGIYRLTGTLPEGRTGARIVLAVGHGLMTAMFQTIFGALAIAFGGMGIAGAIVGVTIWQRIKAKKA